MKYRTLMALQGNGKCIEAGSIIELPESDGEVLMRCAAVTLELESKPSVVPALGTVTLDSLPKKLEPKLDALRARPKQ